MLDPVKRISQVTAPGAPDMLKAQALLSATTVKTFTVEQEELKLYWKLEKRPRFSK